MDTLDFFINLGVGLKEMKQPMTLEEAIDIVDPNIPTELPEETYRAMAKEIKAKALVAQYARMKLNEESENG